jgi:RNA polymerase primary sigma factor
VEQFAYNDDQLKSCYYRCDNLLSKEEEEELFRVLKEGTAKEQEQAKESIISHNYGLVFSLANKYSYPGMNQSDNVQEGMIGLLKAIDKFDYKKGFRFSTYATWWIRQKINRAALDKAALIRIPVHRQESLSKFKKMEDEQEIKDKAELLGMTEEALNSLILTSKSIYSLDETNTYVDDGNTLADTIEDKSVVLPSEQVNKQLLSDTLEAILNTIPERYKLVLELRFGLTDGVCYTLDQVGEYIGLTREAVRQIEGRALKLLRHPSRLNTINKCIGGDSLEGNTQALSITRKKEARGKVFVCTPADFKDARQKRGSQRSVAAQLGISHPSLGRLERGERIITDRWWKALISLPKLKGPQRQKDCKKRILDKLVELEETQTHITRRDVMLACGFHNINSTTSRITELLKLGYVENGEKIICPITKEKVKTLHLAKAA